MEWVDHKTTLPSSHWHPFWGRVGAHAAMQLYVHCASVVRGWGVGVVRGARGMQ